MTIDIDSARERILRDENLTMEEHQQLYDAWRALRESRAKPKPKAAPSAAVKGASLDDLFADFGVTPPKDPGAA